MQVYKTVKVPATEETTKKVADFKACDRCGLDVEHGHDDRFETVNTEIESFAGDCYPGGDADTSGWHLDCCHDCFENHVLPALELAGFKIPAETDRNW